MLFLQLSFFPLQSWDSNAMRDQLYVNACTRYYGDADLVTQCSHRMYLIMRLFMWLIGVFGKGEDSPRSELHSYSSYNAPC